MRWTSLAALAATTCVCVCAAAAAVADAPAPRSCPYANPAGARLVVQFLRTTGDTCAAARAVARGIQASTAPRGVPPPRVAAHGGRYECTYRLHAVGEPGPFTIARCVRAARIVTMRLSRRAKPV